MRSSRDQTANWGAWRGPDDTTQPRLLRIGAQTEAALACFWDMIALLTVSIPLEDLPSYLDGTTRAYFGTARHGRPGWTASGGVTEDFEKGGG